MKKARGVARRIKISHLKRLVTHGPFWRDQCFKGDRIFYYMGPEFQFLNCMLKKQTLAFSIEHFVPCHFVFAAQNL